VLAVVPAAGPHFDGTLACACRYLEGGIATFINFARAAAQSNDPTLAQFLEAWDRLDAQAQEDPSQADALCRRLRLSPLEVLRAVVHAAIEICTLTSGLMAALALPEVVAVGINSALKREGVKDREMFLLPRGRTVRVSNQTRASAGVRDASYVPFEQDILEAEEVAETDSTKRDPTPEV
jgi:hypothetical protein